MKRCDTNQIPLVYKTLSRYSSETLKNTFVLICQHLLKDTHLLMLSLQALGLNPQNVALIGKCYSTNADVVKEMKADGYDVFVPEVDFNSHIPFDLQFNNHIQSFLAEQISKRNFSSFEHVVVSDDGGGLITVADKIFSGMTNIVGVEQTSSGFNCLKNAEIKFPVVNVARSASKLKCESPFVAEVVLKQVGLYLGSEKLKSKNILVIGNGAVGSALYNLLLERQYYNVSIYDVNPDCTEIQPNQFETCLAKADLIFGCTGRTSVNQQQFSLLKKGAVLVSASSSDCEFDAVHIRRRQAVTYDCHANMVVDEVHLLNCGFPVNFSGSKQSMPLYQRQLTMSLLLAGICQAKQAVKGHRNLIPLDVKQEKFILQNFMVESVKTHVLSNTYDVRYGVPVLNRQLADFVVMPA